MSARSKQRPFATPTSAGRATRTLSTASGAGNTTCQGVARAAVPRRSVRREDNIPLVVRACAPCFSSKSAGGGSC